MPKKTGDQQHKRAQPVGEIGQQLASSLLVKDARLDFFSKYVPIPLLMREGGFFRSNKKTKALIGANKSTKTTAAIFEAIMIFVGIIPKSMEGVYAHEKTLRSIAPGGPNHRPRRVRIIVGQYSKHWPETIRPLLLGDPAKGAEGMLPEAWSTWSESEHMFTGPDGSFLSIVAVDPHENVDPNILRGPLLDHTVIDEINQECVWTESLTRGASLKDGPKTVTLSYCPQEGYECWHYDLLYGTCYDKQSKKRKPPSKCSKAVFAEVLTMKDNPSISDEVIADLVASMREWEVAFRVHGEYSHRTGNPYFRMETLIEWEKFSENGIPFICEEVRVDTEYGMFDGRLLKISERDTLQDHLYDELWNAVWRIWEEPMQDEKYVLTADVAEGHPRSDFQVADIWKCTDPKRPVQVAQLRIRQMKPGDFGQNCCCMANCYGNCLVVPEALSAGQAFIDRTMRYVDLYRRSTIGKAEEKITGHLGWSTNRNTKGPLLENCYKSLTQFSVMKNKDETPFCPFKSRYTLREFESYEERIVRKLDGTTKREWGGRPGTFDDCVIAAAIALRIINHEYDKISTCNIDPLVIKTLPDLHDFDKPKNASRAFSRMKPQRNILQIRRQALGRK